MTGSAKERKEEKRLIKITFSFKDVLVVNTPTVAIMNIYTQLSMYNLVVTFLQNSMHIKNEQRPVFSEETIGPTWVRRMNG